MATGQGDDFRDMSAISFATIEYADDVSIAVPSARFVLVHYHIFKNAGTTIEYILRRTLGRRCVAIHGPDQSGVLSPSEVGEYLAKNPDVVAITSHHIRYPKPILANSVVFDICFLRDPLPRFYSYYRYLRQVTPNDGMTELAAKLEASKFFELLIDEHPNVVNNPQLVFVANAGEYTRPPDPTDLARAAEIVRTMAVPGVIDIFDRSLIAAEYFLRPAFPELPLHYITLNAAENQVEGKCPPTIGEFRAKLGVKVVTKLRELNRLDEKLVALARAEVNRRFRLVPNLENRIKDFNARCKRLQRLCDEGKL